MFSPDPEGPQREPPPRRIIFANLMDYMACKSLLENLPRILREMSTNEAARNEVVAVLHRVAPAMERAAELLRTHLKVPALFVSTTGMLYWGGMFQQFVYLLTKVCSARSIESHLCAPNLRVGRADFAVYYDHGMRLGMLTFDETGNRTSPEATITEYAQIQLASA